MSQPPRIELTRQGWYHRDGFHCRGWCWDAAGTYQSADGIASLFPPQPTREQFQQVISTLNGCFAIVCLSGNAVFAAVDRIRSMPLFYTSGLGGMILSDDARIAAGTLSNIRTGDLPLAEFLLTGYVTGRDTLCEGLFQMRAGEMLEWDGGMPDPTLSTYYSYVHRERTDLPEAALHSQLEALHMDIACRLAESAAGRQIVIPLSGGLDSRLIARCLAKLDVPDVLCFSYGNPRSREARLSKVVANAHKLPWVFVPQDAKMWHSAYQSDARKHYYLLADNLSASAHIQDWLAVRELQARHLVREDAVFVPGHSADFLEGSHLPELFLSKPSFSPLDVAEAIIARHYRLWNFSAVEIPTREALTGRIMAATGHADMSPEGAAGAFETFDWRERQAKFIVNSVRVYEFFGYDWRLPLWDNALLDFWSAMPLSARMGRSFYLRHAEQAGDLAIPRYTHENLLTRVRQRIIRDSRGYSYDARYARFLSDPSSRDAARAKVASLCPTRLKLPSFVDLDLPILRADINALQTLVMLREWLG